MKTVHFKTGMDWLSDGAWERENQGDNRERLERLRRNLQKARREELTRRQQEIVRLYYDEGMTVRQIAAEIGRNPSTVSRTLRRAKERLHRCLRYSL